MMIISSLVLGIGIYYCYICNGGNKGENFADKFICLLWVISFRYCAFIFGILLFSIIILTILENEGKINEAISNHYVTYIKLTFSILLPFWIYYRIGHHIKDINRRIREKAVT